MSKYVTQEHFDAVIGGLRIDVQGIQDTTGNLQKETGSFRNDVSSRFDEVIGLLKRLDQDRIFMVEWIRRIEGDVSRIKNHLKLA